MPEIKRVLILEDDEGRAQLFLERYPDAVVVASAVDCVRELAQPWDFVFLDHDLGACLLPNSSKEDCGMAVVEHILEHRPEHLCSTRFVVHSTNTYRGRAMAEDLRRAGYQAEWKPFTVLLHELKSQSEG